MRSERLPPISITTTTFRPPLPNRAQPLPAPRCSRVRSYSTGRPARPRQQLPGRTWGPALLATSGGTSLNRPPRTSGGRPQARPRLRVRRRPASRCVSSARSLWAGYGPDCGVHVRDGWRAPVSAQSNLALERACLEPLLIAAGSAAPSSRRRPAVQPSPLGAPLVGRIWAGYGVRVRP